METNVFSKVARVIFYGIILCLLYTFNATAQANSTEIDSLLKEAREKASIGDLDGAAILYNKILQQDKNHKDARNELAAVLVGSQINEPFAEQTDAMEAVLDSNHKQNSQKQSKLIE